MSQILIVGGGLAGSLAALALSRRRPDIAFKLIEQGETFGGNHTWSFFESDLSPDCRWLLDGVDMARWPAHEVHFPNRSRTIAVGYNSIRSSDLDRAMRGALRPEQYRLGARVEAVGPASAVVNGETIEADAVVDARGPVAMPGLELGWQKFIGRYCRFSRPHGLRQPVIMDATVKQIDGYRFIYQLPVAPHELLIEDTYYSKSPSLDHNAVRDRLDDCVDEIGTGPGAVIEEESGVLPVVLDGDVATLWRGEAVARLGLRGGFFHPTTSYSLPDAVTNAALLSQRPDVTSAALYAFFRDRAERLWAERSFFRMLNRMLFRAAQPGHEYRVLEHFYRLPPPVIGRFYGARLTALDKIRILSGRPPVPIHRAIYALLGKAK